MHISPTTCVLPLPRSSSTLSFCLPPVPFSPSITRSLSEAAIWGCFLPIMSHGATHQVCFAAIRRGALGTQKKSCYFALFGLVLYLKIASGKKLSLDIISPFLFIWRLELLFECLALNPVVAYWNQCGKKPVVIYFHSVSE